MPQHLVFTWPYALLFWLVFLWAFAPESLIVRREGANTAQDANSKRLIMYGQAVAAFAAFELAWFVPAASMQHELALFWAGVAIMIGGSLLRRHCWRMLGQSFTGAVIVTADQSVIDRGAYRYVRHPSYTGGALLFLGIGMALANWASIALLLISISIVYGYRVKVEEAALANVIGEPYVRYMSRTKRFVPFVF